MFVKNQSIILNNRRYFIGKGGISEAVIEDGFIFYLIYNFEYRLRASYSLFKEKFITAFIEVREDIVSNVERVLSQYGLEKDVAELKQQYCLS